MEPLQHRIDTLSNWLKTAGNESVVTQFERLQQELNKVVGYEVDGSPITTAKLLVDIATAEQQSANRNNLSVTNALRYPAGRRGYERRSNRTRYCSKAGERRAKEPHTLQPLGVDKDE